MNTFCRFLLTILTILILPVLNAQDITGDWYGVCQREDSLQFYMHIYKEYDRLKATYDLPDANEFNVPIDKIYLLKDTLYFWIYGYGFNYKGYVKQDYSLIDGEGIHKWSLINMPLKYGLDLVRKKLLDTNKIPLGIIPAHLWGVFPVNIQKIPYNGIREIEAGIPGVIEIARLGRNVITPGKGIVPNPKVYELTEFATQDEYTGKEYYSWCAPVIVKAKQRRPVPVQSMRMNDKASFNIQYLDMGQGLTDGVILGMLEDSRGNVWFGSNIAGICRYDGRSLTYYDVKEGLTNNTVSAIYEDSNGHIWIGTDWGLCRYDGKSFIKYPGELFEGVSSIMETRKGNIWAGTRNGAFEKERDSWTNYTVNEGLPNNQVFSIAEDKSGNIWFGTAGGTCKFDGISFTDYEMSTIFNITMSVTEDKSGNLWFGTDEGVFKYDGKFFYQYTVNEGLSSSLISCVFQDNTCCMWLGNRENGVNIFDGKTFTHLTCNEGLSNNVINSIIEDRNRNVWLATNGNGAIKIQRNSFAYLAQFESLGQGKVNSIFEDRNGNIWFGIFGVGLVKFDGESFVKISGEWQSSIRSITEDKDGNIWFTNHTDLHKYNEDSKSIYFESLVLRISPIECMYKDKKGNIWLGTSGDGIKKYDGVNYTWLLGVNNSQTQEYITAIFQDKRDNIWYGTISYGLFKYDGDSITQYTVKDGLSHNCISSLFEDETGYLWVGTTGGGINKFDGQSFIYFTEEDGLSNNFVSSVIGDKKGDIWVGTRKGLSLISPRGDGNYSITSFGTEDGLKDLNFNQNSVCLDSKNRLWWGTGDEVTILDLNTFKITSKPPVIQLNNIYLNQKFIDFRSLLPETEEIEKSPSDTSTRMSIRGLKFSAVAPFYNYPLDLELPHYLNHVTFDFSALEWSAPQSVKYQYMVEGLDKQWSSLSTENQADYRNIPAGKYIFRVKAISKANIWSETLEYPFIVHPPFWFRWWAFSMYAIIFILSARYFVKYLISRERIKAEVQIKQVEVDKMQELDRMKSRFFANISHEFRTPLTLLIGPINDLLKKQDRLKEGDRKLLSIMKRNAGRLHQLINQLLDLSKLETGNLRLEGSEGDLTWFIRTIVLSFLSLAESKRINYEYDLQDAPAPCFFDEDKVEKIITNLVSNALKFTPGEGSVMVTLRYTGEKNAATGLYAEIRVKDTGPGIPDDEKEKIFDRFYQVSSSDTREQEGSGIGLALTKELVELYMGEIHIESEPGKGSTFTVMLPVSRGHFRDDEVISVPEKTAEKKLFQDQDVLIKESPSEVIGERAREKDKDLPVILIVEDNTDLRKYISGNLSDQYKILEAENGRDGLEKAVESIPDLVISDLMMPEMDGREMCDRLKKDTRTDHIPLVMLTAKADRDSKLESLETGADDYIIKPFDAEELLVRVRNLIEQRKKLRERYRKEFLADPAGHEMHPPENEFMVRLTDCMKKHLEDPDFSVKQLCEELHLSHTQLYRKVLGLTDYTPNEYIRHTRLKMAARMFLEGHTNITGVLYSVGYSSPSYFTQSFRELFGLNPSEYIKQKT